MKLEKILSSALLPTLPQAAIQLLDLSRDPDAVINDYVVAIKLDPAISIKLLKAANSSYFSFRAEVNSIERAVPLLGINVVTSLVLSFSLVDSLTLKGPIAVHYKNYWQQSIVQAAAAETIGVASERGIACEHFLSGLLLDIGRLAMLRTMGDNYLPVYEVAELMPLRTLAELEQEHFGFDHTQVGHGLLTKWGLDPCLLGVVESHHKSIEDIQLMHELPYFNLVKSTAFAAAACDYLCQNNEATTIDQINRTGASFYEMDPLAVGNLLNGIRERIDRVADMFDVDVSDIADPQELLVLANERLADNAIRNQAAASEVLNQKNEIERAKLQLENQNSELREQAFLDGLTGVYNRRFFDESFAREITRSQRESTPVSVLMIDLDHFKSINDTYGHMFGDHVLKIVASTLQSAVRGCDTVARYGGEEFIIIAHHPTIDGLPILAEKIREAIEMLNPEFNGVEIPITASLGAVIAGPEGFDIPDLQKRMVLQADQLLYKSKKAGRNQFHIEALQTPTIPPLDLGLPHVEGTNSPV